MFRGAESLKLILNFKICLQLTHQNQSSLKNKSEALLKFWDTFSASAR